jgi:nitroreductase
MSALAQGIDARSLIGAAVRAPSSHNTQPWIFAVRPNAIDLYADRTRALAVNDPDDRELTISCGAALLNLRVALATAGRAITVDILAGASGDEDHLATVHLVDGEVDGEDVARADATLAALADEIPRRRTHRRGFDDTPIPEQVIASLSDAVAIEGASLHRMVGDDLAELGALVAEGDRIQFADRRWRRELACWMHPRRNGDGLTVALAALPVARLVVSAFNLGSSTAARDGELVATSPLTIVVATDGDTTRHWLRAGQALQRLLLTASRLGLQASYMNQPCQVAELRPRLQALVPTRDFSQLILRLGRPAGASDPSPRRPIPDVMVDATTLDTVLRGRAGTAIQERTRE